MLSRLFTVTNLFIISVLIACLALFVLVLAPADPSESDADTVTRIHFADNISAAHRKLIERFNEKYRGEIEVVPVDLPFNKFSTNERKQLLTRSFRSKTTRIDVFAVDLVWVPRFVKWAEPLSSHFTAAERSDFLPYALESCYFDSVLVSVPFYIDIGLMYYRKDILQKLPDYSAIEKKLQASVTWEEFVHFSRRPELAQHPFYLFPADNYEGLVCSFVEATNSQGAPLFTGDSLRLNTLPALRALRLLVNLVNQYRVTPPLVTEYKEIEVYEYALAQDAIFFRGWPGNLQGYRANFREKIDNIGVAALPHFERAAPASIFGGWNLMISKDSEKKAQALKFLKFITSKEMQQMMYEEMGYLPANRRVYEDDDYFASHPELRYMHTLLEQGTHRPALVEYTKISDILSFYIKKAIKLELPPEQALQRAQEAIRSEKVLVN